MNKFYYFLIIICVICGCRREKKSPIPHAEKPATIARAMPLIIIDAGHGGESHGALAYEIAEKYLTFDLASRLQKKLHERNLRTLLTRDKDDDLSLAERSKIANRAAGAVFISIHANAAENTDASGVETFFLNDEVTDERRATQVARRYQLHDHNRQLNNEEANAKAQEILSAMRKHSQQLARVVQRNLVADLNEIDRGVKQADFAVLRENFFGPAILVEVGFLSHEKTAERFDDDRYRQQIAESLARSIMTFIGEK